MASPLPAVRASRLGALDPVHDVRSAFAGHSDAATLHAAVQITAAAALLEEGVEGSEQLGHYK